MLIASTYLSVDARNPNGRGSCELSRSVHRAGLTLVRRQVVINGRRPDVLFTDGLSRHLLVEIQRGRLDEDHLQRHCYYFYDYRQKYPSTHPRLMFIANRMVPQHKDFLADHGYEYKEIPEQEFARKVDHCLGMRSVVNEPVELVTSPGVLAPATSELIYDIERHRMTMSYKMLLLIFMTEMADDAGRVPLLALQAGFRSSSSLAPLRASLRKTRTASVPAHFQPKASRVGNALSAKCRWHISPRHL